VNIGLLENTQDRILVIIAHGQCCNGNATGRFRCGSSMLLQLLYNAPQSSLGGVLFEAGNWDEGNP